MVRGLSTGDLLASNQLKKQIARLENATMFPRTKLSYELTGPHGQPDLLKAFISRGKKSTHLILLACANFNHEV